MADYGNAMVLLWQWPIQYRHEHAGKTGHHAGWHSDGRKSHDDGTGKTEMVYDIEVDGINIMFINGVAAEGFSLR